MHIEGRGTRLREERERLGLTQADFAERLCVDRKSQINYESGLREPKADYLDAAAGLGVDVLYVVTGTRAVGYAGGALRTAAGASVLTAEEAALVDNYRHAGAEGRRAIEVASAALAKPEKKAG